MSKRLTTEEFIARAKEVHGDRYDYTKVVYEKCTTKVEIICKEHGSFWQTPINHLRGSGCPHCGGKIKKDTTSFIECARKIHNGKYDYSKVDYKDNKTKVCIICPIHGEFWQAPSNHLSGQECPACKGKIKITTEIFIARAVKVHGDKYIYDKVKYKDMNTKVCILCPIHGEFWQTPDNHLQGKGCPICGFKSMAEKQTKNTEYFIEMSKLIHGCKYDYTRVEYISAKKKVCIVCPEHDEFWQSPNNHLNGQGCPKCKTSLGENKIEYFLTLKGIEYIRQYSINIDPQMFSRNNIKADFYLPRLNVIIEFNGVQHYKKIPFFHRTEDDFAIQVDRDKRLRQYCKEHKIKLIEIKYDQIDEIDKILNRKLKN
jgi:hypothetical protein|nr:MAG TPA: restriction enzyme [Caudoviricetes sp.]